MASSKLELTGEKILFDREDVRTIKECTTLNTAEKLSLIADMMRLNVLTMIAYARSGHIGTSLSPVEVLTVLYHHVMDVDPSRPRRKGRDIFILSKGHAAPLLYAILASRGFIPDEKLLQFRRFGGLEGHVDVSVPGVDASTGSLGMGISKAKGHAWAYKSEDIDSSVYVMAGDGELQEGQNWEAIQSAAFWKLDNLYLIIDKNRVQTDMEVRKIVDPLSLEAKFKAFGWYPVTIDGHKVGEILRAFKRLKKIVGKPKAIIANTIKGKGISFMEHPRALKEGGGFYKWHDGIPNEEEYARARGEIASRIRRRIGRKIKGFALPVLGKLPVEKPVFTGESLVKAFSECLVELGEKRGDIIVLDADLAESCGLRKFQHAFPRRFIEIGIAEEDMVSMAGGLALAGKLPIVNTYTAFLTSRSNEQIFNNCSEGSKIIYVGHLAGILPAKPGKSHQGIRDISLLRSIPNLLMCQPCNAFELRQLLDFLVFDARQSSYLRLEHHAPRRDVRLPEGYKVKLGVGAVLADGDDAVLIGYGPLLLSEALLARGELKKEGFGIKVVNLPWLNNIDGKWLTEVVGDVRPIFCLENHSVVGGQSEEILRILAGSISGFKLYSFGIEGYGLTGGPSEILGHYGIDWLNIAKRVKTELRR